MNSKYFWNASYLWIIICYSLEGLFLFLIENSFGEIWPAGSNRKTNSFISFIYSLLARKGNHNGSHCKVKEFIIIYIIFFLSILFNLDLRQIQVGLKMGFSSARVSSILFTINHYFVNPWKQNHFQPWIRFCLCVSESFNLYS